MSTPHYTDGPVTIWHGDCLDVMRQLPDDSVDAVVTDPPYGLEFMGREWDSFKPAKAQIRKPSARDVERGIEAADTANSLFKRNQPDAYVAGRPFQAWCEEWAREAYRLLKPGGHLLAFGGTRTFHRLAAGIEDAGFEIRDSIAWLYGSGFPKSLDVSKAMDKAAGAEREAGIPGPYSARRPRQDVTAVSAYSDGVGDYGSSLVTAPATADAARWNGWGTALKPAFEPIVVARKPLTGTVAANVLAHGTGALNIDGSRIGTGGQLQWSQPRDMGYHGGTDAGPVEALTATQGRWPANVVLDASQAAALDQQSGVSRDGVAVKRNGVTSNGVTGWGKAPVGTPDQGYGGEGGASRFFYTAKASTDERPSVDGIAHPTVKPVDLMRWLVKLVTPPGGVVLEPFAGSGTTVEAAVLEGFRCIAIEREGDYLPLILQRIRKPHAVGLDLDWDAPTPDPTPIRPAAARTGPRSATSAPHPGFDFGDDWELDA